MADFLLYGQLNQFGDQVQFSIGGVLPQFSGSITVNNVDCSIEGTLNQFSGEIETAHGTFFDTDGSLPQFGGNLSMLHGQAFELSGTFKQFTGAIAMSHARVFSLEGTLKQFTGAITTHVNTDFTVSGTVKQFSGNIEFAGTFRVLSMNPYIRGVTEYTNYDFESLVDHNGRYYGINNIGIFVQEGATDNGTAITGTLQTGQMDFGTAHKKGLSAVYAGMVLDGEAIISCLGDSDVEMFRRTFINDSSTIAKTFRIRPPYSKLSRFWSVNIVTEKKSVDTIEIEIGTVQKF
jgi:hypothetical protein